MFNADGVMTHGKEDDMYHVGLMQLIRDFVTEHPDYFAAGFISSLAYQSQYISDEQIERIKEVPVWFVQSADDRTTIPENTVIPVYQRLKAAGAGNVHFSFYDHVVDITGFYGGEDFHYNGHWSWVYCHANLRRWDYDGSPVEVEGRTVTIMEWLAAQTK